MGSNPTRRTKTNFMDNRIEELAWNWLELNWKIKREDMPNLVCYPHVSMNQLVVEFYDSETDKIYHEWFLTTPMVQQLIENKNPKKIRNEYIRKERIVETN